MVLILGDASSACDAVQAALIEDDYHVIRVIPGSENRRLAGRHFQVDLSSETAVQKFHELIKESEDLAIGAVINMLGLGSVSNRNGSALDTTPVDLVRALFHVAKQFGDELQRGVKTGGGWLINVTSLDGQLGCSQQGPSSIAQAGTLGICKTLAKEWRGVQAKNIDFDPSLDPESIAAHLRDELSSDDPLSEVGFDPSGRWTIRETAANLQSSDVGPLPIDSDSVILLTGGARGVTAAAALEVAQQASPQLILIGRTPLPGPEPPETSQYDNVADLRRYLIQHMRSCDENVRPADIEKKLREILKDREIHTNLQALRAAGARVQYHALDVRDTKSFATLIDNIYDEFGRLDGVVHAAGVVDDKLIRDKTWESFSRVFTTKVESALILADRLRSDSLKFMVFFSSVAARLGSAGQIDYSAANEFLNKLAAYLDQKWPARVVAINWGPWDGGMMTDDLRSFYKSRDIQLIGKRAGARSFLNELRVTGDRTPEVLIAAGSEDVLRMFAGK